MKAHTSLTRLAFAAFGTLLLLTACSSGSLVDEAPVSQSSSLPGLAVSGLDGSNAADIANPWLTSIQAFRLDSNTPGTGDIRIATLQYSPSYTVQDSIDWYGAQVELDSCLIAEQEDNSTGSGDSTSSAPYVSAGASVVINTLNGTWFTVDEADTGIYEVDNALPDAIPAGATISIPGLVFPSVGAISIDEPAAPVRIAPEFGAVSIVSQYQWQAAGGDGVFITMSFIEYDSTGGFVDFAITCNLEDDGEFTLPDDVLVAIANNTNTLEVRYTRRLRTLSLVEGVVAYSRISVAE